MCGPGNEASMSHTASKQELDGALGGREVNGYMAKWNTFVESCHIPLRSQKLVNSTVLGKLHATLGTSFRAAICGIPQRKRDLFGSIEKKMIQY